MADPDQQLFISKGFDGKILGSRANQLIPLLRLSFRLRQFFSSAILVG